MASLNKVILIGNLGKDPEVISFDNGTKKMTVSLATTERYRQYVDNQNVTRHITEIVVDKMMSLGGNRQQQQNPNASYNSYAGQPQQPQYQQPQYQQPQQPVEAPMPSQDYNGDDLPF